MPHQTDTACDLSTPRKSLLSELIPPEPTHSYHLLLWFCRWHSFCGFAAGTAPVVWINDVVDAILRGARAAAASLLLRVSGSHSSGIGLLGNDFSRASAQSRCWTRLRVAFSRAVT